MPIDDKHTHLIAALPPSGHLQAAAHEHLSQMRDMVAPYFCISLTRYAEDYDIQEAKRRYGIDLRPTGAR
jgi:hypothetical protein